VYSTPSRPPIRVETMRKYNTLKSTYWRKLPKKLRGDSRFILTYLLTNDATGPTGIQQYSPERIQADLGFDAIHDAIKELISFDLIIIEDGYVWTPLRWLNEATTTGRVLTLVQSEVDIMPEGIKKAFNKVVNTLSYTLSDTSVTTWLQEPEPEPDKEPEQEKKTLPDKSGDTTKPKKKEPDQPSAKSRQITDCYQKLYVERFNKKPAWGKVEGKRIRELLERFDGDVDRICSAMRTAFESDDMFLAGTVGSFMTLTAAAVIAKADTMDDSEWTVVR